MRRKPKSFKSEYQPWLLLLLSADVALALWLMLPGYMAAWKMMQAGDLRIVTIVLAPVALLFVVDLMPIKFRTVLVFWRRWSWQPGCEAFSRYALSDARIDMTTLTRHTGALPKTPAAENARWFQLFKQVEGKPDVRDAQRRFLMYRDMACLSLCLLVLATAGLISVGGTARTAALLGAVLVTQYLIAAFVARHCAGHLVCTVLALHTVRKVTQGRRTKA